MYSPSEVDNQKEKDNVAAKALEMSLKYNFVTPLTSMVVTKTEDGREGSLIADKLTEGRGTLKGHKQTGNLLCLHLYMSNVLF